MLLGFGKTILRGAQTFLIVCLLTGGMISPARASEVSLTSAASVFSSITLYANIETMGIIVKGANLPKTAQLYFRQDNETDWRLAHPLVLTDGGFLAGSLFGLFPAVKYQVKVVDGTTEITDSATTQTDELAFKPATILYVDANAGAGGNGSSAAPFRTIQEGVNHARPGTQVLVANGVYHETVSFPTSGTANQWIQVKAQGNQVILDGSMDLAGAVWQPYAKAHIWVTRVKPSVKYLARDQQRFYMYDNLSSLINARAHGNVAQDEGWYMTPGSAQLYVRSLEDPAKYTWQVPRLNHAFDISSRDWIWIEGFEMQFYGTASGGCGVCVKNSSHVVIRKNKIHNMQNGIYIYWDGNENQGNDTRIEYNEIYDPPVNEWAWKTVKATSMEGTAIVLAGHIGAIVRENNIHNFFNGIYTGSSAKLENSGVALDADIYNNNIQHISDDALEPEGACVNQRFRNNQIDRMLVGVSLAPVTQGPTWVLRTLFTNYTGSSIKWDRKSDGAVFIYHNTSWTNLQDLNAMSMISPTYNSVMRNNIFQGNGYAFEAPFKGSSGHDWNYDDWFSTRASGPRFVWEKTAYKDILNLCAATKLECNGFDHAPGFTDPGNGDFTISASSLNLDRGLLIPGINDEFVGNAPDIGVYEFGYDALPRLLSGALVDANPTRETSVHFLVTFSEAVTGVDLSDFALTATDEVSGAYLEGVSGLGEAYTVTVNTGSGDGTLRLSLLDDDTILDSAHQPLSGIGNGKFELGNEYTIARNPKIYQLALMSNGANDGWVIESGENGNIGNGYNASSPTFYLGDNAENRQFLTILEFSTAGLPDDAIITSATLKIKKLSVTGTDPFATHGNVLVDIKTGAFGLPALQSSDFQALASLDAAGAISNQPVENWYAAVFPESALQYINKIGETQFRLRFELDDNNDYGADTVKVHSGEATSANRPQLLIEYYILK